MVGPQAVARDPAKDAMEAIQALKNVAASWMWHPGDECDGMTPEPLGAFRSPY